MKKVSFEKKRNCREGTNLDDYWIKNSALIQARKSLGFDTMKDAAENIGIGHQIYRLYEELRVFPPLGIQRKIAEFYKMQGIPFDESIVFSDDLKEVSRFFYGVEKDTYNLNGLILGVNQGQIPTPDQYGYEAELESAIKNAFEYLTPLESTVLNLHFGFTQEGKLTYEEIGSRFNLGSERVRQIKEKAIKRLKRSAPSNKLRPFWG
jgi:RNA polymerase sigma factor (sigma-70 family)